MIVKSALADLDLSVGRMRSVGGRLILESGEGSSLEATVAMTPADVGQTALAFLRAPSAWLFVLRLPVAWMFKTAKDGPGARRYPGYVLNHPWLDRRP